MWFVLSLINAAWVKQSLNATCKWCTRQIWEVRREFGSDILAVWVSAEWRLWRNISAGPRRICGRCTPQKALISLYMWNGHHSQKKNVCLCFLHFLEYFCLWCCFFSYFFSYENWKKSNILYCKRNSVKL